MPGKSPLTTFDASRSTVGCIEQTIMQAIGCTVTSRSDQQDRHLWIGRPRGVAAIRAYAGAIGHGQAHLGGLSTADRLRPGRDDAILEELQVMRIDPGDKWIVFQTDVVHGRRSGVGVCRRDKDIGRGDAGCLLDALADALRGGLADENDVVGDE